MANRVVIDVEARFVDNVSADAKGASDSIKGIGDEAEKARKKTSKLGKEKVKPIFDADTNKFLKKIREAEARAKKFGNTKTVMVLKVIDKATTVIGKILNKAQSIAGKVWSAIVKIKDSNALSVLKKVVGAGKEIAGRTWSAIVKVKDYATAPLRKIKESLFSIKSLVMAVAAGWTANKLIAEPVSLSDSIESARIAFENKLGSAAAANQFLDKIYAFDEKSPFDTIQIVGIAQQMMNMGWTAKNVLTDLESIGDWAASMGKGEEGIAAVTRALGQMRQKGKLSSEEMLQLTEAGVSAWDYLAKYLGVTVPEVRALAEDGALDVNDAITGILAGMGEFSGSAAANSDRTVSGIFGQLESLIKTKILLPWGDGLSVGLKKGLGKVKGVLEANKKTFEKWGGVLKDVGEKASTFLADKLETAIDAANELMETDAFKNASTGGKLKMLWDVVIADPFGDWWDNTVVPWWDNTVIPWLEDKAGDIGEGLGTGLSTGIATLLGLDLDTVIEDGTSIGGSFMDGFLEGFDTDKIGQALTQWVENNKGLATVLGTVGALKLLSGAGNIVGGIRDLFGGGGGSGGDGDYTTATMTVNAAVVNVNGPGSGTPGVPTRTPGLPAGTPIPGTPTKGIPLGFLGKAFGIIGAALGLGSAGLDVWQGYQEQKAGNSKGAKDNYWAAGSKTGMVAAGAGIGALIGSIVPGIGTAIGALVGAGIGGSGALLGGDSVGKFFSDATDEGGWIYEAYETSWKFFTETLPEWWDKLIDPEWWSGVIDTVSGSISKFFTETLPYWVGWLLGAIGKFFTETVPEWAGNVWNDTIVPFFTESVPYYLGMLWGTLVEFFTETLPEWASNTWDNHIVPFFTESVPEFFSGLWDSLVTFFTESLPSFADSAWSAISTFFTETLPGWFSDVVDTVSGWFGSIGNSFTSGFNAGSGKSSGGSARGRGVTAYARGGIVDGSTRFIRVNEEAPEMIIPLSNQRRDRALKLWAKTGEMLGIGKFARGGQTSGGQSEAFSFHHYAEDEAPSGKVVQIDVGGITVEFNISTRDGENIIDAIKAQAKEIAETVAGYIADELTGEFENTPLRGGGYA